jgi:hypothetical protein
MHAKIDWDNIASVLDLGGVPGFWANSDLTDRPLQVTCLNLAGETETLHVDHMTIHRKIGDATCPPLNPQDFDLVFSNSVIEHVGDDAKTAQLAAVLRSGRRYFMQTPNRFFLVEPHFILPLHFLMPTWLKSVIVMIWDRGPRRRSYAEAHERVTSIRLLTAARVAELFPDAEIVRERRWLETKSFMAFGPMPVSGAPAVATENPTATKRRATR